VSVPLLAAANGEAVDLVAGVLNGRPSYLLEGVPDKQSPPLIPDIAALDLCAVRQEQGVSGSGDGQGERDDKQTTPGAH